MVDISAEEIRKELVGLRSEMAQLAKAVPEARHFLSGRLTEIGVQARLL